jgi:hypothetical protein
MTVYVSDFGPFSPRDGSVLRLFTKRSSADLDILLRQVLTRARPFRGPPQCGRYVPGWKSWACAKVCWPMVQLELLKSGHKIQYVARSDC